MVRVSAAYGLDVDGGTTGRDQRACAAVTARSLATVTTLDDLDRARALRRGGVGLHEAFDRFQRARVAQLVDHAANAAVEAAMWVTALDDLCERTSGDKDAYRVHRDADLDGQVILGLKWVRNVGVHVVFTPHAWSEDQGFNFPLNFPANAEWQIWWGPVPVDLRPTKHDDLFDGYVRCLLQRSVSESLQAAARWLDVMLA